MGFTELLRCLAGVFFKEPEKVCVIGIAQFSGYLRHCKSRVHQQAFCFQYGSVLYQFGRCFAESAFAVVV